MTCNLDKSIINELRKIALRYDIKKIVLSGSKAGGSNKPTSNIDFAVYTLPGFNWKWHFLSDVDDLNTLSKIDLVFVNDKMDKSLLDNIEKKV